MPVFSYLAYPKHGAKRQLIEALGSLDFCEAIPSDNQEVLILVTDTPDETAERQLQERLKGIESLQSLGMTFGHVDEQTTASKKE